MPNSEWCEMKASTRFVLFPATLLALAVATRGLTEDWPQFLGPQRNGSTSETVATNWPAAGPRVAWSRSVGAGFSGPVVAGGKLFLHQRPHYTLPARFCYRRL